MEAPKIYEHPIRVRIERLPQPSRARKICVREELDKRSYRLGLLKGCIDLLKSKGALDININILKVPGSFELIYGCKKMQQEDVNAIIAIGSVIRGETKHFDFICNATSNGIKDLNLSGNIPVIFCVLTDENMEQAIDRSGGKFGNKGTESAIAAIEMAAI